jgi:hypothetical protein
VRAASRVLGGPRRALSGLSAEALLFPPGDINLELDLIFEIAGRVKDDAFKIGPIVLQRLAYPLRPTERSDAGTLR